jgi:hypothetical protein
MIGIEVKTGGVKVTAEVLFLLPDTGFNGNRLHVTSQNGNLDERYWIIGDAVTITNRGSQLRQVQPRLVLRSRLVDCWLPLAMQKLQNGNLDVRGTWIIFGRFATIPTGGLAAGAATDWY